MIHKDNDITESNKHFMDIIKKNWVMLPNFWDYPIFQTEDYEWMRMDTIRNNAYREAIKRSVKDKVVVEIGTGPDLILALMCIESGAKYVYGFEMDQGAFEKAQRRIKEDGLSGKISLFLGTSYGMALPEPCDVCVSEIIGSIGSSEGAVAYMKDAKRVMKENGILIPGRCITKIAPVTLPDLLCNDPFIESMIESYNAFLYRLKGYYFKSNRYLIPNFPLTHFLGKEQVFEEIDFNGDLKLQNTHELRFSVLQEGTLDGFLLWINLYVTPQHIIDTLHQQTNWSPLFLPSEKLDLKKNDLIDIICEISLSDNMINPNYIIKGTVHREKTPLHSFVIKSLY